jgi:uncharacterized phage-associated protein
MASVLDVAHCLIHLAAAEEEPDFLTPLRLHKLVYYAQAWSLARRSMPLFEGRIQACEHGPVVQDLYPQFAAWGNRPIDPAEVLLPASLSDEERDHIQRVWDRYKVFSAIKLRHMTREETPWKAAHDEGKDERGEAEITHDAMREYFTTWESLRQQLADLDGYQDREIGPWLRVEDLEDLVAQHYHLPEEKLANLARSHQPPPSWYEATDKPF